MDKRKKILLTYDYELFLGSDSGDLYNCLINPTNRILEILSNYKAKGLFFVDTAMLLVMKDTKCFDIVKQQIQDIVLQGHDIGLHIHPHWQDAKLIDNCRWKFEDYSHYRLHSFEQSKLHKIVKECYALLNSIVNEVKDYTVDTFRAGGWSIQPFSALKEIFQKVGIKYDFSVLPGMNDDDRPKHYYDFKNYPNTKYIWKFSNDILVEDKDGEFIEIANTTYNMNIIDLMQNKKLISRYKVVGDGKGAGKKKTFLEQLKRVRWNVKQILSSDAIDIEIFKKYIFKIDRDTMVSVSHPKLFSDNSFKVLEYICQNFDCISYIEVE